MSALSVAHVLASVSLGRPQSAHVCLVVQTCSFATCLFGAVYAFSRIFSPFSLCKHYYIVQYRRNKYVFVPSRRAAAVLLFCAVVVDLSVLQRMFEVFQSTFSRVHCGISACKQSNLCCYDGVSLIYVAQMYISYTIIRPLSNNCTRVGFIIYSTTVPSLMSSVAFNRRRLHARSHAPRPRSAAAAAVQQSRM